MTRTQHPSENPDYLAKHTAAFREPPTPLTCMVGDHVWILDHYYPGIVRRISAHGTVTIATTNWDHGTESPVMRRGEIVTYTLNYYPEMHRQLRVDAAAAEFWPTAPVEATIDPDSQCREHGCSRARCSDEH